MIHDDGYVFIWNSAVFHNMNLNCLATFFRCYMIHSNGREANVTLKITYTV